LVVSVLILLSPSDVSVYFIIGFTVPDYELSSHISKGFYRLFGGIDEVGIWGWGDASLRGTF
jgi:hypothetical protein